MDLITDSRALMIVGQLLDIKSSVKPILEQEAQKPKFSPAPMQKAFARATPESQGVSSQRMADFLNALRDDATLDMHGVIVVKNGKVIAEATFGAYDQSYWHITHSECKSITGLAIGLLIDEGKMNLDDRIVDIFAGRINKINQLTHRNMTIRHLLTMTSGITFNEAGSVTEKDWVKCFLESAVLKEPGSTFNYNSMNTYMLGAAIRQVTGQGLVDYLKPRLFEPLGITNFFWETCPMGNEKGGWGLYILPEDIAKIGWMVMSGGRFDGQQIVAEDWIKEQIAAHAEPPKTLGNYDYGYQTWVGRNERAFLFNGMFGQNVLGFPDSGYLLVSNAGNNELFQQSAYYEIATRFFARPDEAKITISLSGVNALASAKKRLKIDLYQPQTALFGDLLCQRAKLDYREIIKRLDGKVYFSREDKRASAVGLLPLYAQTLQNNFTRGLRSVSFHNHGGMLELMIDEIDERHSLPIGLDAPEYTDVTVHGECHRVGVSGRFSLDEAGMATLLVRVSFLEIANARLIRFRFFDDRVETLWKEYPGKGYIADAYNEIKGQSTFLESILERSDEDMLMFRMGRILEPRVVLQLQS